MSQLITIYKSNGGKEESENQWRPDGDIWQTVTDWRLEVVFRPQQVRKSWGEKVVAAATPSPEHQESLFCEGIFHCYYK